METWCWIIIFATLLIISLLQCFGWQEIKIVVEVRQGVLSIIYQYIYYFFATALFMLIIVFSQKVVEVCFNNEKILYSGVVSALTWSLVHIFTKDFKTGIFAMGLSLVFGIIYL